MPANNKQRQQMRNSFHSKIKKKTFSRTPASTMRLKRNKLKGQQPIASSLVVVVAFHSRVGESQMSRRSRWRRNYLQPALTSLPLPSPITCFYFQFIGHMILFRVALLARARLCWWWWSRKWRKINKLQLNTSQRETAGKESVRLGAFNESHESRRLTFGNVNFDWPATRKQFRHRKWWTKIHRACWHFQCRFTSVTLLSRAGNFHRTFGIYFRTLLLFSGIVVDSQHWANRTKLVWQHFHDASPSTSHLSHVFLLCFTRSVKIPFKTSAQAAKLIFFRF